MFSPLWKVLFCFTLIKLKQNKICIAKMIESHDASTWESRIVPGWRTTGLSIQCLTGLANHRAGEPGDRQRRLTEFIILDFFMP